MSTERLNTTKMLFKLRVDSKHYKSGLLAQREGSEGLLSLLFHSVIRSYMPDLCQGWRGKKKVFQ